MWYKYITHNDITTKVNNNNYIKKTARQHIEKLQDQWLLFNKKLTNYNRMREEYLTVIGQFFMTKALKL